MSDPRTFKINNPRMKGPDVVAWEKELIELYDGIGIDAPIVSDGVYGDIDRSYTQSLCYAFGIDHVEAMKRGVTPELRTKLRHRKLTDAEKKRMDDRVEWRRRLRERYARLAREGAQVSTMVQKILQDSWGYHPGVHDGIDIITLPDVPGFAPVKSKVIDVRQDGWWRLGAPKDPTIRSKGDGIVQLEVLETVGPFKKGYHIGFGHAEKIPVKVGQIVKAGQKVCHSGLANAWHWHWMLNDGSTTKGIGNIDPRAALEYTKKNG